MVIFGVNKTDTLVVCYKHDKNVSATTKIRKRKIELNDEIQLKASSYEELGFKSLDALHIASTSSELKP